MFFFWNGDDDEQDRALYALEEEKTWSCIMNILEVLANAYFSASRQAVFSLVRMRICLNPNPYFPAVTTGTDTPARFVTLRVVHALDVLLFPLQCFWILQFLTKGWFSFWQRLVSVKPLSLSFPEIPVQQSGHWHDRLTDGHIGKSLGMLPGCDWPLWCWCRFSSFFLGIQPWFIFRMYLR